MPADLTPAELIAELERQRHKADQDAQRRHHGTHYDYRMRGYYEGRHAALRDALALVRPVVERLTEELAAAEATAEDEEAAHLDTIGLVCRSLAGTLGSADAESRSMPQWLERVRERVERVEREPDYYEVHVGRFKDGGGQLVHHADSKEKALEFLAEPRSAAEPVTLVRCYVVHTTDQDWSDMHDWRGDPDA